MVGKLQDRDLLAFGGERTSFTSRVTVQGRKSGLATISTEREGGSRVHVLPTGNSTGGEKLFFHGGGIHRKEKVFSS